MGLDARGSPVFRSFALDHVGVQGPLGQEVGVAQLGSGVLEDSDKLFADDLPLLLGVGHLGQLL